MDYPAWRQRRDSWTENPTAATGEQIAEDASGVASSRSHSSTVRQAQLDKKLAGARDRLTEVVQN